MFKTVSIFFSLSLLFITFSFRTQAATACGAGTYCPNNSYTCNSSNKCCSSGTPACGSVCCASSYCVSGVCKEPFSACTDGGITITPYCKIGSCHLVDNGNGGQVMGCTDTAGPDNSNPGTAPLNPVDGVCIVYANPRPTIPTNLCFTGTPQPPTPMGTGNPWTWQCMGANGGNDSPQCTATSSATAGECVTTNPPSSTPPTNLCSKGTPTSPQPVNTTWVWRCLGSVTNADCSSTRIIGPACNNNICESGETCEIDGGTSIYCPGRTAVPNTSHCDLTTCQIVAGPPGGGVPAAQTYSVNALPIGLKYHNVNGLLTFVVKLIISLVGVGFMIMLLYGAFRYVTSQGDKAAVQAAQGTLTSAIIGLSLAAGLFAIMTLLQNVLGISLMNITI